MPAPGAGHAGRMTSRRDIEFPAEDGTILRGWLYEPDGDGPSARLAAAG